MYFGENALEMYLDSEFLLQVFVAVCSCGTRQQSHMNKMNKNEGSLHLEIHLKFPTIAKINIFICIPIGSIPGRLLI